MTDRAVVVSAQLSAVVIRAWNVADTRIPAEIKIKHCGEKNFSWGKNRQAYCFSMKIRIMDL